MRLDGKTNAELILMDKAICDNPENHSPPGSLSLYKKKAQKKLDDIAWAITANLKESREKDGDPVLSDGYSGMKKNRR